jgi:hypothetical protein
VIGADCAGSCKSNYHIIMITTATVETEAISITLKSAYIRDIYMTAHFPRLV